MADVAPINPCHAGMSMFSHGPCIWYTPDAAPWLEANAYILPTLNDGIQAGQLKHHPYLLAVGDDKALHMYCPHAEAVIEAATYLRNVFPEEFFRQAGTYRENQRGYSPPGLLFSGAFTLWSHILMLGYLYYERSLSLVTDEFFDQLCKAALWRHVYSGSTALTGHPHAHLFSAEGMAGGSVHEVTFPLRVQLAAELLARRERVIGYPEDI